MILIFPFILIKLKKETLNMKFLVVAQFREHYTILMSTKNRRQVIYEENFSNGSYRTDWV